MFKIIAAVTLLSGVSTLVAFPASEVAIPASGSSIVSRLASKADRIETGAATGARNYLSPRLSGKPVAFCLTGGSQCGKEAADAFCRGNGFGKAITFERGGTGSDPAKLHFRQIKCLYPQAAELARASNAATKSARL